MVEQFFTYLEVEKRYSNNTIISYKKDLADFASFVWDTEGTDDLMKVDKKVVRNFLVRLSEQDYTKRSINRKLSSLRSYYLFLLRLDIIKVSPVETVKSLKFYPEKQIPISQDEAQNLDEVLQSEDIPLLERVIVEVLYQTGMRKAELCGMLLKQIDLSKQEFRVIGKGNKERIIPISENLFPLVTEYLTTRRPISSDVDYFLIGEKGKKVGPKFVYSVVNKYLSVVTTKVKRSPHILRHSFATHVLNNGAEISKVKKLMGHSSLASTQVYTNANIDELKKVFNRSHPRAQSDSDKGE